MDDNFLVFRLKVVKYGTMGSLFRIFLLYLQYEIGINYKNMIMKWNDVELIDGKFYFVEVERWGDGKPNNWLFSYKENELFLTEHYVAVRAQVPYARYSSIYDSGHVCGRDKIISIRHATPNDMDYFWSYLDRFGYKYSVNTKKLRYVGSR